MKHGKQILGMWFLILPTAVLLFKMSGTAALVSWFHQDSRSYSTEGATYIGMTAFPSNLVVLLHFLITLK